MGSSTSGLGVTLCGGRALYWGQRTYLMGVVNVTPDSFSGDGRSYNVEAALKLALRMEAEGADIIDVGGESTRPGSTPVSLEEELARVIPAVQSLVPRLGVPVSVDTYKGEVAQQAVEAGASMINDIWGLKADPSIARVAAERSVPLILMHNQNGIYYQDLLTDVINSLRSSIDEALQAGVPKENIIVDPGIGFGKTAEQNLELLRRLDELNVLGLPLLVGTSRKSTIGLVLNMPVDQRVEGTAATVALAIAKGVDIVRIHDVQHMRWVARMSDAIIRGWRQEE